MKHSTVLGGSTAARTVACPGWTELAKKAPVPPASDYADEGSMLHDAMEQVLIKEETPQDMLGMVSHGKELTQELIDEKLNPALEAFDAYAIEHDLAFTCEERAVFPYLAGSFGTADIVGTDNAGRLCIFDWKFGDGVPVSPEENLQLAFYAAGVIGKNKLENADCQQDPVRLGIIQGGELNYWDTTVAWVRQQARTMVVAVRTGQENPFYKIGDHCRFCPAKAICPEQGDQATAALHTALENLDADGISEWLDKADDLVKFANAIRALAHEMLENGHPVPGYKLVAKRATRRYDDVDASQKLVRRIVRRNSNDLKISECLLKPELISPAQLEKVFKKHKVDFDEVSEGITALSSGTTIAPDADRRPAISTLGAGLERLAERLG